MSNSYANLMQMKKMLGNLDAWLTKAEADAATRAFDPSLLLTARLAPDQYMLPRQIQAACDAAKLAAARLSGSEPPKHPDTETTLAELHARIAKVVAYLESFKASDFDGAEGRAVPLGFAPGKVMGGDDYLHEMATANFYFHIVTAYAILRHNGVPLGKIDYIGGLNWRDA